MRKISIKDIAKLSNASITTVSFALNGKGRISETTRERILDIAKKNGYNANRLAVGLRTGVSKVIGLIVENIDGQLFGIVAKIIEQEAEKFGYTLIYCSTNNNVQKGKQAIKMLSQQLVDGYIITPLKGLEEDVCDLIANKKPVVLIDGYFPDLEIPYVMVDNANSIMNGIRCFVEGGYKNIAFVTKDIDLIPLNERLVGFKDALKRHQVKVQNKHILKLPNNVSEDDYISLIKSFLLKNKSIDAIFFATNYFGILGLKSLKELNIRIPEDIAVISFDDNELFNLYPPGITSIKQPTYEIGKFAIELLLSQIANDRIDISKLNVLLPSVVIKRGSTLPKVEKGSEYGQVVEH